MKKKFLYSLCIILCLSMVQKTNAEIGDICNITEDCINPGLVCVENVCVADVGVACYLASTKTCSQEEVSIDFCNDPNQKFATLSQCEIFKQSQIQNSSGTTGGSNSNNSAGTTGCRTGEDCVSLINPLSSTSIPQIVGNTISIVMGIIGSITFVVFFYGGFLWLTSAGNSEKIAKGLQAMLWAGIGIIVVFSSYAILTLILNTLQASP